MCAMYLTQIYVCFYGVLVEFLWKLGIKNDRAVVGTLLFFNIKTIQYAGAYAALVYKFLAHAPLKSSQKFASSL